VTFSILPLSLISLHVYFGRGMGRERDILGRELLSLGDYKRYFFLRCGGDVLMDYRVFMPCEIKLFVLGNGLPLGA